MKNLNRAGASIAAVALAFTGASAAHAADTVEATASVNVLTAVTVTPPVGGAFLNFGSIAVNGAGDATLSTANEILCDTDLVCTGTTAVPTFDVSGSQNQDVAVSFTDAAPTLYLDGDTTSAETIALSDLFTEHTDNSFALDGDGNGSFTVGGTLSFDGSEVAGAYSGAVNMSIEYQ